MSRSTSIKTFTGRMVDLEEPTVDMIDLEDIAHSLGNLCRFNGHTSWFYSVAQHSVHVAELLKANGYSKRIQLHGLLHDAQEAYIGDMVSPLKRIKALGDVYKEVEDRLVNVIAEKFGLDWDVETTALIHLEDMVMCSTEMRDLVGGVEEFPDMEPPSSLWDEIWQMENPTHVFVRVFRDLYDR